MRHAEFESFCQKVQSGQEAHVKHIVTHKIGKILSCHPEDYEFEVDVNGEHKTWIAENCKAED
ncbi:MAG: hypothetical protein C0617_14320 [Desulfuromonas sp.]|uniref:hypothetical protein n=1 Tax=Desulfuromonas sp. TaxID=892 RepID=UPI000CB918DF|nr:hypothetical protein [Desulfuromonas sp.]PLX82299.1 MAG: hypothetical protein C0617_14320 [Desulfuromonas sp.]